MPLTKEEEKTIQLIEQGIEDIKKNKATKSEVLTLIEERVKTDKDAMEAQLKTANETIATHKSELDEVKAAAESLKTQLRTIRTAGVGKYINSDGSIGKFGSIHEAKAFGLLIMAATTSDVRKADSFHKRAMKSLEDIGIKPKWLDPQGKVMTTGSQASGSALVTIEQIPSLITMLESFGAFRRNTTVVPMGAGTTVQPKIDGLLTVYVPGEGGTITDDDPEIGIVSLVPKCMTALTAYSAELDEDAAVGLALMLAPLFTKSFAYYEDLCGFNGDGTAAYFGFTGLKGALLSVSATISKIRSLVVGSGNAYSELKIEDFLKAVGALPEYASGDAKWYAHRYFFYTVMVAVALASGNANAVEVLTGANSKNRKFLGYDVEFTQVMPRAEANSQICTYFGDLAQATMMGTRGGIEFASSEDRYFEKGIIAVRARNRVAINCHGKGGSTDDADSTAGPIIGVITAAS